MSLFAPVEPHPIFLFANLDDSSIRHRVQLVLRDNHGHQGALELDLNVVPPLPDGKTWDEFQRAYVGNDTGDAQHQAFGRHLFAALSGNAEMRETWQGIHSASSAAGQPLALTAIFGPGTERLARLPLELLHDDAGFLFARPDSAVRRCFARMPPRAFEYPPQPRLLFAWACPPGAGDPFDPAPHEEALRGLFGDRLTVCPQASLDDIGRALATTPCHFVHILAHGFRDEDLGGIALHGPGGGLDLVDAQRLANELQRRDIRLAFLCSCRTAQVTAHMLSGVAQQLLAPSGADLPAVVATQANLPVRGSALLVGQFYELLLDQRQDPATALARARVKAYQGGAGAWSVPVFLGRPPVLAEPRPAPAVTAPLPPRRATFLERPHEMAEILGKLRGHRLVSVVGLPGIGKTELGLEATRRLLADGFRRRLVFCKIERTFNPGILRGLIGARLGLEKLPETDEGLAAVLAQAGTLLLLDNAEDMMVDEHGQSAFREQLDVWLAGAPELVVLLTTRWPVGCTQEREIQVDIPALSPEQTEQLLLAELGEIGVLWEDWPQQPEWRRLLGFLDGHPRSIWLVSHHFEGRNPSLARIVERLERLKAQAIADPALIGRADVFDSLSSAGQDRMRSLVASIDFSFDVLGRRHPDAAEAFLALSLFPAGLPEPVALAVTGGPDSLALDHLYRYHLLEWNRERTFYPMPLHWYAEHRRQQVALARDAYFVRALPAYADYIEQCGQGFIRDQAPAWTERWLLEEDTLL
ncbi:MAG: CHAT domain-containing protein, partial [Candidatus Competibacter sp.]